MVGDTKSAITDKDIQKHHKHNSNKAKFFSNNTKDKVTLWLRKIAILLNRLTKSEPKHSTASDRYQGLFVLMVECIGLDTLFVAGHEAIDPVVDVGKFCPVLRFFIPSDQIQTARRYDSCDAKVGYIFHISSGHKKHDH